MTDTITRLEEAARKATSGPWVVFAGQATVYKEVGNTNVAVAYADFDQTKPPNDSEYIALANPENILALVRVARAAKAFADTGDACCDAGNVLNDTLQTALLALEK